MSKTILLIENDAAFAREVTDALEASGLRVRATGDGKEGLDLARELSPDAIVLCVELPKMSGYSICNKLKKDEALKGIPLILASAEATNETFDLHRKLKTHAEAYLLKPYAPADLLARLGELVALPAPAGAGTGHADEEVVSLEEDLGLEALSAAPEADLPSLDLGTLPDEPAAPARAGEDDDLKLLDDAFDVLSAPPAAPAPPAAAPAADLPLELEPSVSLSLDVDRPVALDEVDAAAASLPDEDERAGRAALDAALEAGPDDSDLALGALDGDASAGQALDALDALAAPPAPAGAGGGGPDLDLDRELAAVMDLAPEPGLAPARPALELVPPPAATPVPSFAFAPPPAPAPDDGGAAAAELSRLEADLAERRAAVAARDAELRDLHDQVDALTHRAVEAESGLAERDAELAGLKARADAQAAQLKRGEADAKAGREEARRAAEQARAAEDRARAAEEKARAAEAQAAAAQERARAADDKARASDERARAAEAAAAAAQEKGRGHEAQAAAALADATALRGQHAEVSRSLAAKVAELAAAAAQAARLQEVERDVERLETELIVARGEVEGARDEVEKRSAELQKRIADLEAANAKNEERVVKAYLKIKGDEKVRDKARKALSIALQLLEEGLPPEAAKPGTTVTTAAPVKAEN